MALCLWAGPRAARAEVTGIAWENGSKPCWEAAGQYHSIDPWLLVAIAYVESRYNPQAMNRNKNGTWDVGLMQINSTHLATLRRYGVPPEALRNACASTFIGAWILSANFRRYGYSWQAIAAYNTGSVDTPARRSKGLAYAQAVYRAFDAISHGRKPPL